MEKLGRILLVGVIAGLALSISGTVTQLVLNSWRGDAAPVFREQGFQIVVLGFFFDLVVGFLYVLAFALYKRGCDDPFWKKFLLFWLLLMLINVVPRAADVYRYFEFPKFLVLAWLVSWAAEALIVTALVTLFFPKREAASEAPREVPPEELG